MKWKNGEIKGVQVMRAQKNDDPRGWLSEVWRSDWSVLKIKPEMAYVSFTHSGVTRGPHEHVHQTDYFVFLGWFKLRLWDGRRRSKTFGVRQEMETFGEAPCVVLVPPGVVHAYRCVKAPGLVLNMPDALYRGKGKAEEVDEIRHENDPSGEYRWRA